MTVDQLLDALLGDRSSFEQALARTVDVDAGVLLLGLLRGLEANEQLENAERERRLTSVFVRARPNGTNLASIGQEGARLTNAVLRNALTQLLPPDYRALVFPGTRTARSEPQITGRDEVLYHDGIEVQVTTAAQEQSPFSDVIILSITDDPATHKLLESQKFLPLRCQSIDEFERVVTTNDQICAFLVESSFLKSLDREHQAGLIAKLARFSTFVWLRLQEDGLIAQTSEISELIAEARCRTSVPTVAELSFRDRAGLQEKELSTLQVARKRLTDGEARGLFIPGELSSGELKLLGSAMSQYSKQHRFNPRAELSQVTTKFLQNTPTAARVAMVKVNDLRMPLIVKVDQQESILDEARRFLTFIYKDNQELKPEVHLHAGAALIVFGIIPDPHAETEQPAPTLEQRLTKYWYMEMADPAECDAGAALLSGFSDAARRLAILNKQRSFDCGFECKANPYLIDLKEMERKGFDWGLGQRAMSARVRAESIVAAANRAAICHGDAHTRNILIRGDQGFLIDYAYSGPGHPCSDLVKLELSVYLTRFTPFGTENELAALQHDLSIDRLSFDGLLSKHKSLLRSKTNELCLKMCVAARDLIPEVLVAHNLAWDHYIATKVLAAWQALQVPSLQQSLVRGIISRIST
jgi:hypothetical protein